MGTAAIIIEQEIEGQKYETVHGVQGELDLVGEDGQPSEAFLSELFNNNFFSDGIDGATDPTGTPVGTPLEFGIVGSLLYFHRYLQARLVRISRLYITDGRKSSPVNPPIFYSLPLDLQCRGVGLGASQNPNEVAPANQALLIDKVPRGFGKRAGRMFLRCAMTAFELRVGGLNGVEAVPEAEPNIRNRVFGAASVSGLNAFYDEGTDADQAVVYSILNYFPKALTDGNVDLLGQVRGSTGVSSVRYGGITGRQTNRPSKRR